MFIEKIAATYGVNKLGYLLEKSVLVEMLYFI